MLSRCNQETASAAKLIKDKHNTIPSHSLPKMNSEFCLTTLLRTEYQAQTGVTRLFGPKQTVLAT